jgi:hypothetical protein
MFKPDIKMNNLETQLVRLLSTLWDDSQNLFLASMPLIVDELERLLQSEPTAQELISPYFSSVISDLSIISQSLN